MGFEPMTPHAALSVIVLSLVVAERRTTSDHEEARWPPARPHAAPRQTAPCAASRTTRWGNIPEGLAVFARPKHRRRRMRSANPMERADRQERKRRRVEVRVFPDDTALERLVSAV